MIIKGRYTCTLQFYVDYFNYSSLVLHHRPSWQIEIAFDTTSSCLQQRQTWLMGSTVSLRNSDGDVWPFSYKKRAYFKWYDMSTITRFNNSDYLSVLDSRYNNYDRQPWCTPTCYFVPNECTLTFMGHYLWPVLTWWVVLFTDFFDSVLLIFMYLDWLHNIMILCNKYML